MLLWPKVNSGSVRVFWNAGFGSEQIIFHHFNISAFSWISLSSLWCALIQEQGKAGSFPLQWLLCHPSPIHSVTCDPIKNSFWCQWPQARQQQGPSSPCSPYSIPHPGLSWFAVHKIAEKIQGEWTNSSFTDATDNFEPQQTGKKKRICGFVTKQNSS